MKRIIFFFLLFIVALSSFACNGDCSATNPPANQAADGDTDLFDATESEQSDAPEAVENENEGEEELPDVAFAIPDWLKARQEAFMEFSCAQPLNPSSKKHVLMHLTCEERLSAHDVPAGAVADDAFDGSIDKLWRLKDTSDFDMLDILNLLYAYEGNDALSPTLWGKLKKAVLDFKYWYTDETPERIVDGEQVVDNMWYWTENHVLLFRVNEYLAGQRYREETFAVTGKTGAWHEMRAKEAILQWIEERARWGFTEWHSNVYYNCDMKPLLSLVELAEDETLKKRAAMILDILLLDMALHTHKGTFGATHGRSYIKDKPAAVKEDVFDTNKFFFEDTEIPFQSAGGTGVLFARAENYQLPYVIRTIARYDEPMIDKERMNLPLDERPPDDPSAPLPEAPYGLSYTEEYLPLWWSMSGFLAWPLLPLTFEVAERYSLWDGQFEMVGMIGALVDLDQSPEEVMKDIHPLYKAFWKVIPSALLKEVYTYTHRTKDTMLSSALDYRAGRLANQLHPWQATLSEAAIVFTQQPAYLPLEEGESIPDDWNWQKEDEPGPGYWTGEGSLPRVGQHENVAIILYAPQFTPKPLGFEMFNYRDETHAYFPHAHFDEVVQEGKWTFGKKDEGYVALYSHQPTFWREGQPEVYENGGLPFDLVAEGAMNAWIVETGRKADWQSFAAFRQAVSAAAVTVESVEDKGDDGFQDGYDVSYVSPSVGLLSFGWHEPLMKGEESLPLRWEQRFDNPFMNVSFDETRYEITNGEHKLTLDFTTNERTASKPPSDIAN